MFDFQQFLDFLLLVVENRSPGEPRQTIQAYGALDQYRVIISGLREVADIPIIIDTKGPEIRLKAKGRIVNKDDVLECAPAQVR
jgi:hypothetical protein